MKYLWQVKPKFDLPYPHNHTKPGTVVVIPKGILNHLATKISLYIIKYQKYNYKMFQQKICEAQFHG